MRPRRLVNRLHLYLSVVTAVPLMLVCLTGVPLVYETELIRLEHYGRAYVSPRPVRRSIEDGARAAMHAFPNEVLSFVVLPSAADHALIVGTDGGQHIAVDPYTLEVVGAWDGSSGWMPLMRNIHTTLLLGETGRWIVTASTVIFVLLVMAGAYLWWKRPGTVRERLVLKWSSTGARFQYQLHAAIGAWFLIPLLLIGVSGVLIGFNTWWRPWILDITGSVWTWPPQSLPAHTPQDGEQRPTLDVMIASADELAPQNTRATGVYNLKASSDVHVLVERRYSWGSYPAYNVWLDRRTGRVVRNDDPFVAYDVGQLIHRFNRGLHSGHVGTEVMRWIWASAAAIPLLLTYSGFVYWWNVRQRKQLKRLAEASPMGVPEGNTGTRCRRVRIRARFRQSAHFVRQRG